MFAQARYGLHRSVEQARMVSGHIPSGQSSGFDLRRKVFVRKPAFGRFPGRTVPAATAVELQPSSKNFGQNFHRIFWKSKHLITTT